MSREKGKSTLISVAAKAVRWKANCYLIFNLLTSTSKFCTPCSQNLPRKICFCRNQRAEAVLAFHCDWKIFFNLCDTCRLWIASDIRSRNDKSPRSLRVLLAKCCLRSNQIALAMTTFFCTVISTGSITARLYAKLASGLSSST